MRRPPDWKRLDTRVGFECPWFRVRQDDIETASGHRLQFNVLEHPGWVMVVPVLADGRVVMEHVYRFPIEQWTLECPSGGLDGEPPEVAARRELEEETGWLADELIHLGHYSSANGYAREWFDIYLARDPRPEGVLSREVSEEIEVELIPLEDLRSMAVRGEIADAPTSLAILLTAEYIATRGPGVSS